MRITRLRHERLKQDPKVSIMSQRLTQYHNVTHAECRPVFRNHIGFAAPAVFLSVPLHALGGTTSLRYRMLSDVKRKGLCGGLHMVFLSLPPVPSLQERAYCHDLTECITSEAEASPVPCYTWQTCLFRRPHDSYFRISQGWWAPRPYLCISPRPSEHHPKRNGEPETPNTKT